MKNKFICFFVLFCAGFMLFLAGTAYSGEYHHVPRETITTNIINYSSEGVASAIAASQQQFYWGTKSWQGSASFGAYDNNTAISFGLAKRFNKTLINGSVSIEGDKQAIGGAVNWLF